jgi:hypothetical protein
MKEGEKERMKERKKELVVYLEFMVFINKTGLRVVSQCTAKITALLACLM